MAGPVSPVQPPPTKTFAARPPMSRAHLCAVPHPARYPSHRRRAARAPRRYCNNDSKTCQEDPCSYFNGTAYVRGCATAGAVCMQPPGYLRSCKVVCTPNGTECNALSPM